MRKPTLVPTDATAHPVYLTAAAINSLIQTLPSGTAYCIGSVLMVMMTGRLMQPKGSLARAVLPLVIQLRGGWHRKEPLVGTTARELTTEELWQAYPHRWPAV
jgi:hypothetical protein